MPKEINPAVPLSMILGAGGGLSVPNAPICHDKD